jgi:DNA-directed RNA polymerase specialized sigma24 family protein
MDVDGDGTHAQRFVVERAALVLHVAGLLDAGVSDPIDQAVEGLRRVVADDARFTGDADRLALALGVIARAAHRATESRDLRPRGGLDLRDVQPVQTSEDDRAARLDSDHSDPEAVVRSTLTALTSRERAVVVLHLVGGLDMRQVARALRRPVPLVRRDLDRAVAFLGSTALGRADPTRDTALVARALRMTQDASASGPLTERLRARVLASPPRPSRTRWVAIAVATAAVVAVAAGAVVLDRSRSAQSVSEPAPSTRRAGQPDFPIPELPTTASGLKLVGFDGLMLAVPEPWRQISSTCRTTRHDVVIFPTDRDVRPCLAPARGATVSFGRASLLDLPSVNRSYGDGPIDRVVVTSMIERGPAFVQFAALLDTDVVVAVRAARRNLVSMVISSVQRVPRGCVAVPDVLGQEPTTAGSNITFAGLRSLVFADSSISGTGIPLEVVVQTPEVGTVLPGGSTVNLAVTPR